MSFQACLVKTDNLISEFNNTNNPVGCSERCYQSGTCQHWTWWDKNLGNDEKIGNAGIHDRFNAGNICQLFVSCSPDPTRCDNCFSGPRSCGLWNNSLAAVSGGKDDSGNMASVELVGKKTCKTNLTLPHPRYWGQLGTDRPI